MQHAAQRKLLRILTVLLVPALLLGCQTSSSSGGNRVSHGLYTPLFDQGSHLQQLIDTGEYDDALALFEEQNAYFTVMENRKKLNLALQEMADHYNNAMRRPADNALTALEGTTWPSAPDEWPTIRKHMMIAKSLLDEYPSDILLEDKNYGLAPLRKVKELYAGLDKKISADLQSTFDQYDHFDEPNFFLNYAKQLVNDNSETTLNSLSRAQFTSDYRHFTYISLAKKLEQAGVENLRKFTQRYPDSGFFPKTVRAAYFRGLKNHHRKHHVQAGLSRSATALHAEASAILDGYLGAATPQSDVSVITVKDAPNSHSNIATYPVILANDFLTEQDKEPIVNIDKAARKTNPHAVLNKIGSDKGQTKYWAIFAEPIGQYSLEKTNSQIISSLRPIKTDRRLNPKWTDAKNAFDDADKLYQEAGGDEEFNKPIPPNNQPGVQYCGGGLLGCAIGAFVGGVIVGAVESHRRQKRTEILELNMTRHAAQATLSETPKELVTHTYGPYTFTRSTYRLVKGAALRILSVDALSKSYSLQEYRSESEREVAVLENVSALDKTRDVHFKDAVTPEDFEKLKRERLNVTLSRVIAAFKRTEISRGRYNTLSELKALAATQLSARAVAQ